MRGLQAPKQMKLNPVNSSYTTSHNCNLHSINANLQLAVCVSASHTKSRQQVKPKHAPVDAQRCMEPAGDQRCSTLWMRWSRVTPQLCTKQGAPGMQWCISCINTVLPFCSRPAYSVQSSLVYACTIKIAFLHPATNFIIHAALQQNCGLYGAQHHARSEQSA